MREDEAESAPVTRAEDRFPIIGIGTSAGGLPALEPGHGGFVLVVFEERETPAAPATVADESDGQAQYRARVNELEVEQQLTQERLQEIIKDYEASKEELRPRTKSSRRPTKSFARRWRSSRPATRSSRA